MIVIVVCLMISLQMRSVNAVGCNTVHQGVPTFKNCTYRCHCKNDAKCDETTGECISGCSPGWAGPACQYRDATNGYAAVNHVGVSTLTTDKPALAVDGDISTCSKSTPQPGQYDYWFIELNRSYLINGLSITVPADFLDSFKEFSITLSMDGVNFDSYCYRHNGQRVSNPVEVACTSIILAKYVKIKLEILETAIRVCEVSVLSGREIAFNKQSAASSLYDIYLTSQTKAIDGNTFVNGLFSSCFASSFERTAWWRLDINGSYLIQDVYYMGRSDCCPEQMRDFQIQIGNSSSGPWQTIFTDTYTGNDFSFYILRAAELQFAYESNIIRLVRESNVAEVFVICEVQIYGECPDGLCGWECTDVCQCSTPPTGSHRIQGTCPTGCKDRYSGRNGILRCDIECDVSHWGLGCANICGNCYTTPCDVMTGTCTGGCSGPWKPPLCNETCDDGWFGINCSQPCGHCENKAACDKTTGICPSAICEDGWVFGMCKEQCLQGSYGRNCSQQCGQCSEDGACFHADGKCNTSCKSGYVGDTCKDGCQDGWFGINCSQPCGHCENKTACDKTTGICPRDICEDGWVFGMCKEQCMEGWYGRNCSQQCGQCSGDGPCFHVDGNCNTSCKLGYVGDTCKDATLDLLQRKDVVRYVEMSSSKPKLTGEKAFDGNPSHDLEQCQCCSQTLNSESSWWMVTFSHKYPIEKIIIHGRNNENTYNQIGGFSVDLSNTTTTKPTWKNIYTDNISDVKSDFEILVPKEVASSVRIRRAGVLTICEIQIMEGDCRTGWYGKFCSERCHCADEFPCNRLLGTCHTSVCKIGWIGPACNRSCPDGTYGWRCEQKCNCPRCTKDYGICEETIDETSTVILPLALGASAGGIFLVILITAIIVVVRKRLLCFREDWYTKPTQKTETEENTYDTLQSVPDAPIRMEERHAECNEVTG